MLLNWIFFLRHFLKSLDNIRSILYVWVGCDKSPMRVRCTIAKPCKGSAFF